MWHNLHLTLCDILKDWFQDLLKELKNRVMQWGGEWKNCIVEWKNICTINGNKWTCHFKCFQKVVQCDWWYIYPTYNSYAQYSSYGLWVCIWTNIYSIILFGLWICTYFKWQNIYKVIMLQSQSNNFANMAQDMVINNEDQRTLIKEKLEVNIK